ncbi:chemotaxis protein CheD [Natroniella sp. ANB-PHB2]|uniref:chemotaxis protein CheD n=1 Tax=Natroniella sp. ANB-PHB2 TaxID=3384444 RepID=UPI0038D4F3D4
MADLKVGSGEDIIITSGLGSCVGVTLYNKSTKIGGMAHVMLPEFPANREQGNPAKYADTALDMLLDKLRKKRVNLNRLEAKMAGGAQMFNFSSSNDKMRIGARNIEAVERILQEKGIPILGAEVGENYGRTMELHNATGKVLIKTVKHDDIVL